MKKYRAEFPYNNNGRPTFKQRKRAGVYIILENGAPVYVGMSKYDLYKTMYRHFQSWNDRRQVRVVYSPNDERIKVRVVYTNTPAQAASLERALIIKLRPRDNPQKLINYTTTEAQEKIFTKYHDTQTQTIKTYQGEIPF